MNISPNNRNIYFSKGTWEIDDFRATCYNSGANFNFTTDAFKKGNKSIILNFEMPNVVKGYTPILAWRINGLIWEYAHMSEQMTITLPQGVNDATEDPVMNGIANHYIEVWVRTISINKPRWSWNGNINNNVIILKSITIDDSASILETIQPETTMLCIGASFTEGYGTVGIEHSDFKANDTTCSWGALLGTSLGFNVATSGYAGSGFSKGGSGDSPSIRISYKYMDADIPRDFRDIDIAAFNIGSNDGDMSSENFIAAASEMIDDLRTRYPDMILLFTTPFWGTHQSSWLAVSEKYADDAKVIYIETIYPQLVGHPTISNYRQYILPDLVKKAKKSLFCLNNDAVNTVYINQKNSSESITLKPSNPFEALKIKRI